MAICPTCGGSGVVRDPVQPVQPQPIQQPQPAPQPTFEDKVDTTQEIIDAYKRIGGQQTNPAQQPFIPIGVNTTQPKNTYPGPAGQEAVRTAPTNGYTQPKQQPTIDPVMAEQEKSRKLRAYAQGQSTSQLRNPLGTIYRRFGLR